MKQWMESWGNWDAVLCLYIHEYIISPWLDHVISPLFVADVYLIVEPNLQVTFLNTSRNSNSTCLQCEAHIVISFPSYLLLSLPTSFLLPFPPSFYTSFLKCKYFQEILIKAIKQCVTGWSELQYSWEKAGAWGNQTPSGSKWEQKDATWRLRPGS